MEYVGKYRIIRTLGQGGMGVRMDRLIKCCRVGCRGLLRVDYGRSLLQPNHVRRLHC